MEARLEAKIEKAQAEATIAELAAQTAMSEARAEAAPDIIASEVLPQVIETEEESEEEIGWLSEERFLALENQNTKSLTLLETLNQAEILEAQSWTTVLSQIAEILAMLKASQPVIPTASTLQPLTEVQMEVPTVNPEKSVEENPAVKTESRKKKTRMI